MNKQVTLKDIKGLTFIGGQITSRIEADEKKSDPVIGSVQVVPPKAIKNGRIAHEELYDIDYKSEFDEKKLTKAGDIVLKLSSPYDAAYITEDDEGLLITSFCIIIRGKGKEMDPQYLTAFFNSNVYKNQVMNMVSGARVPMLTMGKIKDVKIKIFSSEEQQEVAEFYKNMTEKEATMARIIELEKEKLDSVLGR
ncbi:MAG: restriction endonuclease subunit S [Lachnospiraceae bacterium]